MPRFSENIAYYPFTLLNLSNNQINDPDITPPTNQITLTLPTIYSNFLIKPWNYSTEFDIIGLNSDTTKLISSFTNSNSLLTPATSACPVGQGNCDYCNANECNKCTNDNYLENGLCSTPTATTYYFLSPAYSSGSTVDTRFNPITTSNTVLSVSFFVKVLGWNTTSTNYDLFKFGPGLKLTYDITADTLNLIVPTSNTVLSTYSQFRSLFNSWVNISLSYYYDSTINTYFPAMMNFQVNFKAQTVANYAAIDNLNVNSFEIPKESISIYAKMWVYDKYITGIWGIESDKSTSVTPILKLIDNQLTKATCLDSTKLISVVDFTCVLEYNKVLDDSSYCTNPAFIDSTGTCNDINAECPHGYYFISPLNYCSCEINSVDMMLNKNNDENICTKLDYYDYSRSSPVNVSSVSTGSTEYTIDFWIYVNTYVAGTFGVFDITWDKQLSISISYNSGYKSNCYPIYDSVNNNSAYNSLKNEIAIDPTKWDYIRCSVDLTNKKYYHIVDNSAISEITFTETAPTIPATTTLSFVDSVLNRGVVFFKQIRLWNCYDCQKVDTSSLFLTSTSAAMHDNLLHLWDPVYGQTIDDLKTGSNTITLNINASWIGYNVLDLSDYPTPKYKDFTIYPEDKTIADDFIFKTNEVFYGAWYFSTTNINIEDKRNGIRITPTSDVK